MTDETQPQSNDFRKRIARPLFVHTVSAHYWQAADNAANDYSERVSDLGGEVIAIAPMIDNDTTGDYPVTYYLRTVTYRAPSRIDPA